MRLSRDESREIAAIALMLGIGLRFLSGLVRWLDELRRFGDGSDTFISTTLEPVGAAMAILTLGLALLIVLSPSGSISMRVRKPATILAGVVSGAATIVILNRLIAGGGSVLGRISFTLLDKFPALILASAAFIILRNHEPER